jgi:polyisoprenoid-binding protein YceI
MTRRPVLIAVAAAVVVLIGVAVFAYNAVLGDTKAASGPVTAIPLDLAPATEAPAAAVAAPATEAPAAAVAAPATEAPATQAPTASLQRFQIRAGDSKASFTLDEVLNGSPKTVVGTTDQIAGELGVDPSDLSSAKIGPITINARTLATDSSQRDRAIKNLILSTDTFELITFTPTAISGLSGSGAPGQPYSFQISGNLTIRDITKPVTFTATVQAESASRLSGKASASINRDDFGLSIPSVPFVANVSQQVALEIAFVAESA